MLTSPHDSSNMSGSGVAYATPEYILYSGTLALALGLDVATFSVTFAYKI